MDSKLVDTRQFFVKIKGNVSLRRWRKRSAGRVRFIRSRAIVWPACGLILSAPHAQPHITLPRARRTHHYGPHATAVPHRSFLILITFLHFFPVASASDYQIHHDAHPSYLSSTLHLASHRTPAPKVNPQPQRPPHSASDHEGGRSCCCDPGRCAGVMAHGG